MCIPLGLAHRICMVLIHELFHSSWTASPSLTKMLCSSKVVRTTHQATQYHIPKHLNPLIIIEH